jgi:crossover junction endodeoxyribonuclease RuvC
MTSLKEDHQIILGIDPGTLVMGYGLVSANKNTVSLVEMGVLQLSKYEDHAERLRLIFKKMESLIHIHRPVAVAIEAPFFGKNVQSMLKLGRAQGVAIAAAMMHGLHAEEYAPRKVKQSVTGNGNAGKEQVWEMVRAILKIQEEDVRFFDAADAVAVALCHYYRMTGIFGNADIKDVASSKKKGKSAGWADFIAGNPDRVKL